MLRNRRGGIGQGLMYAGVAIVVFIAIVVALTLTSVKVGHAAILVDPLSGEVRQRPVIGPRWFLKSPLQGAKSIKYTVSFLIFSNNEPNADYGTIYCFSKEGIELGMDITVRYSIDPSKLAELYTNYPGLNWELTTISSVSQENIRFIVKNYGWEDLRDQRDVVADQIETIIDDALAEEDSLGGAIVGVEVDLKNVELPTNLVNAVNAKVQAETDRKTALTAAETAIIQANASAQVDIIDALGDAEARAIRAEGEARAIQYIIDNVGPEGWQVFYRMQKLKEIAQHLDNGEATVILPIDTMNDMSLILDGTP
jgi:regulator of protease activity HflC (stomatin/prohibitin superfamily)